MARNLVTVSVEAVQFCESDAVCRVMAQSQALARLAELMPEDEPLAHILNLIVRELHECGDLLDEELQ